MSIKTPPIKTSPTPASEKETTQITAKRRLPRWLAITLALALGFVALWLAGSYWLLNSQWLPNRISQIDGVEVRWSQGSSHHPGRWEVEGLRLSRDDGTLALAVEAEQATLELSLLALLRGELHIATLEANGIRKLQLGDISLQGDGRFSIRQTTLSRDTLTIPHAELDLTQGHVLRESDNAILARDIHLIASATLDTVAPTTADGTLNPDLAAALSANTELSAHADAWDVFMTYLEALPWLAISGRGALGGTLSLTHGQLDAGSQLTLNAPALTLNVDEAALSPVNDAGETTPWAYPERRPTVHTAQGDGTITLAVADDLPETLTLSARLNGVTVHQRLDEAPYATDTQLRLTTSLDNRRLDRLQAPEQAALHWQDATLPDIAVLQPYLAPFLPDPSPLRLVSGQAQSHGQLTLNPTSLNGNMALAGNRWITDWHAGEHIHRLTSDMQLDLAIRDAALDGSQLDLSGSQLRWQIADATQQERLTSTLTLHEGRFQRENDKPRGQFSLSGRVERLGFLNAFLPSAHGLAISGEGQLFAQGGFHDSQLTVPTRLRIDAHPLSVNFLDYQASGRGELTAQLDSDEQAQLTLGIPRFSLKRQDDERPHVEGRHLALTTRTDAFSAAMDDPQPEHFITRVSLPIIDVPDITRYNAYFPEGVGIALLDGQASLESELTLRGLQGQGDITLRAFGAELSLLEQRLRGDVHMHLTLSEGDIDTMRFVANDSFLRLENVSRLSEEGQQDAGWWAQLDMSDATLTWDTPIDLSAHLALQLRDSGLLARLFLARARENDWLGRMLSVRNITGDAQLRLTGNQLELSDLTLGGGPLLMLADLTLANQRANGALYARLGRWGLGVALDDSEPTLHVLQPRRWFDRWRQQR
ncbi:hypothetical protein QC823_01330 [Halomonas vilamensis]|uniref:AsmA-like C-terminal domain-containing protein n=1 Tax=Vreelandella vilamensis TaxID=531309 RepID=A0ABU1H005_9GAMM|nr:hypothetical protein [Halomonas vilamensis]MDR5897638.1 hypothetical protein [Halomonas vilamensis]